MRLKATGDGPLSYHNGNSNDILNSPKRLNTLQNSNITSHYNTNSATTTTTTDEAITVATNCTLNNINSGQDKVKWCNPVQRQVTARELQLTDNRINRNTQLLNINNTLAASLRNKRPPTASSICSESSPDDSLLDYEDAHQSGSSAECSPQDEVRDFDLSDSDSLSDEGNLSIHAPIQRRGIVNPNYPGFQHLAHTLDFSLKASSDTDFTDDDYECEPSPSRSQADVNNINNNNSVDDSDYPIDKIDSVNRLDSVENIQKVYYDKPVLDIQCENLNQNICDCEASGNSNNSDEDISFSIPNLQLNIKGGAKHDTVLNTDVKVPLVGDFGKEITQEIDRISLSSEYINNERSTGLTHVRQDFEDPYELPPLEQAVVQELEDAIEKFSLSLDLKPSATKYNIEPNIEQPFNKLSPSNIKSPPLVLQDSKQVKVLNISENTVFKTDVLLNKFKPGNSKKLNSTEGKVKSNKIEAKIYNKENIKSPIATSNNFGGNAAMEVLIEQPFGSNGVVEKSVTNCVHNTKKQVLPSKMTDAFLSNAQEPVPDVKPDLFGQSRNERDESVMDIDDVKKPDMVRRDSNREMEEIEKQIKKIRSDTKLSPSKLEEIEKFCKEDITKTYREKDVDSVVTRRKAKMQFNHLKRRPIYNQFSGITPIQRRDLIVRSRDMMNRRSVPAAKDKKTPCDEYGTYDVYNIETSVPRVDMETIENHLRAAREEERRRRLDREEIRRRLTMNSDYDYYTDRPGRKPSLHARLQSGMNLQICFMNETVSDTESPSSDSEYPLTNPKQSKTSSTKKSNSNSNSSLHTIDNKLSPSPPLARPATLSIGQPLLQPVTEPMTETDFFSRQARLQTEARMALAQAKQMARMQMEVEKQKQEVSPITEMVRNSFKKIGIPFPDDKRRVSRQLLTDMNCKQLKVIVNDLHNQIEILNETLVKLLMERDDLHMEQDSMLVDIEDLTRYLGAKEQAYRDQKITSSQQQLNNNPPPPSPAPASPLATLNSTVKPHLHRIASLVKK